jgi:diadenylate cyclase
VGASEQSDAFVIVVSEETGDISVALGGNLNRAIKAEEVKQMFFKGKRNKWRHLWKGREK